MMSDLVWDILRNKLEKKILIFAIPSEISSIPIEYHR